MLDLNRIRNQPEEVARGLARKGVPAEAVERLVASDAAWRKAIAESDRLKALRNDLSRKIGARKKAGEETEAAQAEVREIGERLKQLEQEALESEQLLRRLMLETPNIPSPSVPDGPDESCNRVEKVWGVPPSFSFEPKAHDELGVALGILDFERAAKMSGARFVVYVGAGAALERALISFMLDLHTTAHGYTEVLPPYLVKAHALEGTGNLPKFEADLFKVDGGAFYLIPTAEVPVTNLHRDEILEEKPLPISYCAFTPCFRSEAGSYGKDTKGMIRQHQFHKVELVKYSKPEDSYQELEKLTSDAESVLEALGLCYRRVTLCAGDMSFSSAKTYDLEVWLPSQKRFREISSCSNFEDFQARRANIRYRPEGGGKPRFVHTLNGSGLAVGRTVVAILENYQQADGSIVIPEPLRPYMRGQALITAR
ncbi:MAG: serine--tRNA ligase [Acidobacteria bacterium]|jgi:seryl-tRNA synthetase|nr:serine--tRNA ligase [Acidobacteriota bacterium]